MVFFIFDTESSTSFFHNNKLKRGLVWAQKMFTMCFPDNSAMFLHRIDVWLLPCTVQFQVGFLDAATDSYVSQTVSRPWQRIRDNWAVKINLLTPEAVTRVIRFLDLLPSRYDHIHHGSATFSNAMPWETINSSSITQIQHLFCKSLWAFTHWEFLIFFLNIMHLSWFCFLCLIHHLSFHAHTCCPCVSETVTPPSILCPCLIHTPPRS